MWNLKVPPKVKNFIWKACTGCLPTKDMLCMKQVNVNILCPLCNMESESARHVLVSCTFAQSCWDLIGGNGDSNYTGDFLAWITNVLDTWEIEKKCTGVLLCWSIWKCRNDLVWSQKGMEAREVVESARVVLSQWRDAQDKTFNRSWGLLEPHDGDEHWTLPEFNKTKVNTDAAIFLASSCYAYAFIARNHQGDLVEARSSCKPGTVAPEFAEAVGIREALSWIKSKHMVDVAVETDCLVAVQAIRGATALFSYFGKVIEECRALLKELKGKGVILKFVKRSTNGAAHSLASCSYSIADRVWKANEACPDLIHVLANDLK